MRVLPATRAPQADPVRLIVATLVLTAFGTVAGVARKMRCAVPEGASSRFFARKLLQGPYYDVILGGNSRMYRSLSPARLVPELKGLKVYNFGFSGVRLTPTYLDRASSLLDPKGARVLVIEVDDLTLSVGEEDLFTQSERLRGVERANLLAFGSVDWLFREDSGLDFYETTHDDGFVSTGSDQPNVRWMADFIGSRRAMHRFDPAKLRKTVAWVRAATARGIRIFAVRAPVPESTARAEASVGFDLDAARRAFGAAGARWIDVPGAYRTFDGSHLFGTEAERYTVTFGRRLAGELAR